LTYSCSDDKVREIKIEKSYEAFTREPSEMLLCEQLVNRNIKDVKPKGAQ